MSGYADSMAGGTQRAVLVALLVSLLCATAASADGAGGIGGANVLVYYGPTCHKQYGSSNCLSSWIAGVQVTVTTYPGLKRLASGTSNRSGLVPFGQSLPFSIAFLFKGRVHGRVYQGGWRMTNLQPLSGQTLPLDLLLCPSGAWVATMVSVADSCSERGNGVLAFGAPRGSA